MPRHSAKTTRPHSKIATTIRRGATKFDLHMRDRNSGEEHTLDLSKADRGELRKVGQIICDLQGITNERRVELQKVGLIICDLQGITNERKPTPVAAQNATAPVGLSFEEAYGLA